MHVNGLPPSLSSVYQQLFTAIDKDADGKISHDELQSARNTLPSQAKGAAKGHSVDKLFNKLDANGDGFLTPDEMTPRLSRGAFSVLLAAQEHSGTWPHHHGGDAAQGDAQGAGDPATASDPAVTPPVTDTTVPPPVTDTTVPPPVTDTTVPPPVTDTTVPPPVTAGAAS